MKQNTDLVSEIVRSVKLGCVERGKMTCTAADAGEAEKYEG